VKVSVDGAAVTDRLDGKPVQMDLGKHTVKFEYQGQTREEDLIVGAGQKNRPVSVVFGGAAAPSPAPGPAKPQEGGGGSLVPIFVVGGIGVVAAGILFPVFGLSGKSAVDDLQSCKPHCEETAVDKARTKLILADISLGVGIVAIGVATYMFVTRPKLDAEVKTGHATPHRSLSDIGVDFNPVSGGAMGSVGGRF
jgi:hypothetical protein